MCVMLDAHMPHARIFNVNARNERHSYQYHIRLCSFTRLRNATTATTMKLINFDVITVSANVCLSFLVFFFLCMAFA